MRPCLHVHLHHEPAAGFEARLSGAPHRARLLPVVPELPLVVGQCAHQRAGGVVQGMRAVRARAARGRHGRGLFHVDGVKRLRGPRPVYTTPPLGYLNLSTFCAVSVLRDGFGTICAVLRDKSGDFGDKTAPVELEIVQCESLPRAGGARRAGGGSCSTGTRAALCRCRCRCPPRQRRHPRRRRRRWLLLRRVPRRRALHCSIYQLNFSLTQLNSSIFQYEAG